ncbi:MAG: esterase [Gammaproteobacteria bacterium]
MAALKLTGSVLSPRSPSSLPPLVIAHGLFGSSANWRSLARQWSTHRQVVCVDARNHGSSPHAPTMSYEEQAEDLLAFLDTKHIDNAFLLGHSMGGKTVMHFALHHRERTTGIIIVDIAPTAYVDSDSHRPLIDAMERLKPERFTERGDADAVLAARVSDPRLRGFILHNLVRKDGRLCWRINLKAIAANLPAVRGFPQQSGIPPYVGPSLFILGGTSNYVGAAQTPTITPLFPSARICTVPNAGHWVHAERPNAVRDAVNEYLDGSVSAA